MGHSLTSGLKAATLAGILTPVAFVEIDSPSGNAYLWSGYGNIVWNGQTWNGAGDLGGISGVTETGKVQAQSVQYTLSGVDLSLVSFALQSIKRYYPARLWLGALDGNFNVIADPYNIHNGKIDTASITNSGTTAVITVTVEGRLISMRNLVWRRYTDLDQRIERPSDAGFSMVTTIQDAQIVWTDS